MVRFADRFGGVSQRGEPDARGSGQHKREGIIAPTTPAARVRINLLPLGSELQVQVNNRGVGCVNGEELGQKYPSAALASSDIISGVHGGRRTISASTDVTPGTPCRNDCI